MNNSEQVSQILANARKMAEEAKKARALRGPHAQELLITYRLDAVEGALSHLADALDDLEAKETARHSDK